MLLMEVAPLVAPLVALQLMQDASSAEAAGQAKQPPPSAAQPSLSDQQPSSAQDVAPPASPAQQPWQPLKQQQAYTQIEQEQQQKQQRQPAGQQQRGVVRAFGPRAATAAAAGATSPLLSRQPLGAMQQNLRFADPALEAAYVQAQSEQLAHMDLLFILLNLAVAFCCIWDSARSSSSSSSGAVTAQALWQPVRQAWSQWLLLPVCAAWLLLHRASYSRWREQLWVCHRLLPVLHMVAVALLHAAKDSPSALIQGAQGLLGPQGADAGSGVAAGDSGAWGSVLSAAAAAASAAVSQGALGLHVGRALALLAENLGFKVRTGEKGSWWGASIDAHGSWRGN
jgi:hypothetical protein